jgi:hypothetical protein
LEYQRPSGRYEEGALYAATESEFRLFDEKVYEKLKRARKTDGWRSALAARSAVIRRKFKI